MTLALACFSCPRKDMQIFQSQIGQQQRLISCGLSIKPAEKYVILSTDSKHESKAQQGKRKGRRKKRSLEKGNKKSKILCIFPKEFHCD